MQGITFGEKRAKKLLIQPVDERDLNTMEEEVRLIREFSGEDFRLIAFPVDDWNRDLSPWKAPAVFGKEDFGGAAEETLAEILKACEEETADCHIGGYSLAGLFALWAATRTDRFRGVAAASPSVWYPGFADYLRANPAHVESVYLSLGDKEEKTRNAVMATVGTRIREVQSILDTQGVRTNLEWNEGNHFRDAELRTAKAFAWQLKQGQ